MADEKVGEEEVKKIAHLARLKLEGDELKKLTADFNQILQFVDDLNQADIDEVDEISHVLGQKNITRKDEVKPSLPIEEVEKLAVAFENRSFVVPRVIEEER